MNYTIYATKSGAGSTTAQFYLDTSFNTGTTTPFIFNSSNKLGDGLAATQSLSIGINDSIVTPVGATTMTTSLVAIDVVNTGYDVGGKLVVQISPALVA